MKRKSGGERAKASRYKEIIAKRDGNEKPLASLSTAHTGGFVRGFVRAASSSAAAEKNSKQNCGLHAISPRIWCIFLPSNL